MTQLVLRVIGTSTTITPEVCRRAREDLGFEISFEMLDGTACLRRGVLEPDSFDIYDQWIHSVDLLWTAGSIRPIDTARIRRWNDVRPAGDFELARRGSGTRPADVLFVQPDNTLGVTPPDGGAARVSVLPTVYNTDSFAYTPEVAAHYPAGDRESWAWLLDEAWHGRALLAEDPAGGAVELVLAARAAGERAPQDPGNLTIEEIDELFAFLMARRRAGDFGQFWDSTEESQRMMSAPGTAIGSLWSPAYYQLRSQGHSLIYADPREGSRGWHAGMCLSSAITDEVLEMAYAYLNWWIEGVPGAIMARRGYYISVVEPLRDTLSPADLASWSAGEAADADLPGVDGTIAVLQGERRAGGSFLDRMARTAVWSTIMPEHNYLIRRWREFIAS